MCEESFASKFQQCILTMIKPTMTKGRRTVEGYGDVPQFQQYRETFIHLQACVVSEFIVANYRNIPFFSPIHHLRRQRVELISHIRQRFLNWEIPNNARFGKSSPEH